MKPLSKSLSAGEGLCKSVTGVSINFSNRNSKMIRLMNYLVACLCLLSCKKSIATNGNGGATSPPPADTIVNIVTDKAVYKPGDVIHFTIDKALPASAK